MLAVVGHPLGERALHRQAAEDGERRFDRRAGVEALVREVAVEADRRAEGADDVEAGEEDQVVPVEGHAPQQSHGREEADRRDGDARSR